ncbi:class I and II aminotransferase [Salmonella enterica subsp. salamae serovar Sofia]|nr:class I and II aminotransferase [Salmonella enterica subsp. salamae serovar Sofia]
MGLRIEPLLLCSAAVAAGGLDDEQLKWVMADVAGIAPSMGSSFGPAGSGFIRLNLGCPRTYLEMAIDGLKRISVKSIKSTAA